ncbi:MAG: hypothetical protein COB90_09615 [Hyphomicrobiales bacterium]|nr:MAG: hypothetical protein COB90_09615 [Hyphomicrobiales bacterium]
MANSSVETTAGAVEKAKSGWVGSGISRLFGNLSRRPDTQTGSEDNLISIETAIEMLGDENIDKHQTALDGLKKLVRSNPDDHYIIAQQALCDYIRSSSRNNGNTKNKTCSEEIIGAFRLFSDLRNQENIKREQDAEWDPDLGGANLRGFPGHGRQINLSGVKLRQADLSDAKLNDADLEGADLNRAILDRAVLIDANLSGAALRDASLKEAELSGARMIRTDLFGANLEGAWMIATDLSSAWMRKSNLKKARLDEADLSSAWLRWADLTDASLRGANLSCTLLNESNLTRASLIEANIAGVFIEDTIMNDAVFSKPVTPENLWPKGWCPTTPDKDGQYRFKRIKTKKAASKTG